ncbi:phosphotransferase [Maritimibacter sp. UBA3975]|uniref:aminoglycoside phosphotransferase family protein n=1 Tax=Maritimibacter sp. UBA3975 TaxID=1946833 RepID=UPI000C0B46BD|nr:phosphotransferase [Maritimibacter sp. UBA3975]MAM63407.1 aminoglycoside phosphotransferase [Maritimibacter sp.]|tara:strand:- start:72938 stop:73957 length:1020 start_codon:yes stop_codon:yes gene_type:complete
MSGRDDAITGFLDNAGWGGARRSLLAGDASNRRYERLWLADQPAVLMDAPPDKGEDIRPFVRIGRHLSNAGLSPPKVFAEDAAQGFLLLEDLGDNLFSNVVESDPDAEKRLYLAATDALLALHDAPLPDAPDYGPGPMSTLATLSIDWFAFGASGAHDPEGTKALEAAMKDAFDALAPWQPVLVLRDYHAENLLWLPDRVAPANVGLLDFQDAGIGHPAYDLMSLARDARRDVSDATRSAMIAHFAQATGKTTADLEQACATVSAQRNLRILGVFARLSLHFGKPHYVDLIPRVWRNLSADLAHPSLAALGHVVARTLPDPTPEILRTLKAKCATVPTL